MPGFGPPVLDSFRATPPNKPWIIHLAEGVDDVAAAELGRLDELGCLKSNTVVVHGLALSADDTRRIILAGAAVIWCPSSNVSLYGDTLEPRTLFDAGRLALGTDSRISGSPDLLEELRTAASRSALGPLDLFRLVTDAASAVLMLPDVGGLANGQRADLLIVRDTGVPPHEALLRLRRSDIRAVIRGGMPAIADPDYLPWFQASGINAIPIRLDERPKLLAQPLARKEAVALEPGAEWR
jgi:cytosine/adenosine deaminase-related metal-dependent hydrolase